MGLREMQVLEARSSWLTIVIALGFSAVAGYGASRGPAGAVVVLAPLALVVLLTMPSAAWVAAAVVTAVAFRGLVGLELIPGWAQFVHIPLAWGALAVALAKPRGRSELALRTVKWLGLFSAAVVASALVNHAELIRGPVYFALLAEPFAIVAALLVDPPSALWRRRLLRTCIVLVAVQVPICYWQATTTGWGDGVQGTLYGSGAGAHVVGAIAVVGAFWYMARAEHLWSPTSIAVVAALFGIVLVADAKQVVFALPAVLIAQRGLSVRSLAIVAASLACVILVVRVGVLNQGYTLPYLDRALAGKSGKEAVARSLLRDATSDVGVLVVGRGPAESVSRAAFETTPAFQKEGSGLSVLGLHQAPGPREKTTVAARGSGIASPELDSFDTAESSGLGLFGDLGVLGVITYFTLAGIIFGELRRRTSPEASAAATGFAIALLLGFVFDWWEQPPFTIFLGTLAGLALSADPCAMPNEVGDHSSSFVRSS